MMTNRIDLPAALTGKDICSHCQEYRGKFAHCIIYLEPGAHLHDDARDCIIYASNCHIGTACCLILGSNNYVSQFGNFVWGTHNFITGDNNRWCDPYAQFCSWYQGLGRLLPSNDTSSSDDVNSGNISNSDSESKMAKMNELLNLSAESAQQELQRFLPKNVRNAIRGRESAPVLQPRRFVHQPARTSDLNSVSFSLLSFVFGQVA
jgi:hypothetical protein